MVYDLRLLLAKGDIVDLQRRTISGEFGKAANGRAIFKSGELTIHKGHAEGSRRLA